MDPIRQVKNQCPQCGSWYRRGPRCNICNTWAPEPEEDLEETLYSLEGRLPKGRVWDSKKHKYALSQ